MDKINLEPNYFGQYSSPYKINGNIRDPMEHKYFNTYSENENKRSKSQGLNQINNILYNRRISNFVHQNLNSQYYNDRINAEYNHNQNENYLDIQNKQRLNQLGSNTAVRHNQYNQYIQGVPNNYHYHSPTQALNGEKSKNNFIAKGRDYLNNNYYSNRVPNNSYSEINDVSDYNNYRNENINNRNREETSFRNNQDTSRYTYNIISTPFEERNNQYLNNFHQNNIADPTKPFRANNIITSSPYYNYSSINHTNENQENSYGKTNGISNDKNFNNQNNNDLIINNQRFSSQVPSNNTNINIQNYIQNEYQRKQIQQYDNHNIDTLRSSISNKATELEKRSENKLNNNSTITNAAKEIINSQNLYNRSFSPNQNNFESRSSNASNIEKGIQNLGNTCFA